MTIEELQNQTNQWIENYGVRYFSELTNMAILTEEVGELSSLLARAYGDQSFKKGKKPENLKEKIADEMADIFFVVTCMANQMDIDLETAIFKNLEKKTLRDKDRHQNNEKLQG